MAPLTAEGSASSDYFDDDPAFLQALQNVKLPGDPPSPASPERPIHIQRQDQLILSTSSVLKRPREPDSEDEEDTPRVHHKVLASIDDDEVKSRYLKNNIYGASTFGGWGEYMARKRAKLQIQNTEMDEGKEGDGAAISRIFRGLQIYVSLCRRTMETVALYT